MSLDKLQSTHVKLDHTFLSQKNNVALSTNRSQVKEVSPTGQVCAELSLLGIQRDKPNTRIKPVQATIQGVLAGAHFRKCCPKLCH